MLNNGAFSARTDILGIYSTFFWGLKKSASYEVRVPANLTSKDLRSATGKNNPRTVMLLILIPEQLTLPM